MDIRIQPHEEDEKEREIVVPSHDLVVPDCEIVPASVSDEIVRPMVVDGVAKCWYQGNVGNPAKLLSNNMKLYEGDRGSGSAYVWSEYPRSPAFEVHIIGNNLGYINYSVNFNEHYCGSYSSSNKYTVATDNFFVMSDYPDSSFRNRFTQYPRQVTTGYGPSTVSVLAKADKFPSGEKVPVGGSASLGKLAVNVGLCLSHVNYASDWYRVNSYTQAWGCDETPYYTSFQGTAYYGMWTLLVSENQWLSAGTHFMKTRYTDDARRKRWGEIKLITSFGTHDIKLKNVPNPPRSDYAFLYPTGSYVPWHNFEFNVDLVRKTVDLVILRKNMSPKVEYESYSGFSSVTYDDTR